MTCPARASRCPSTADDDGQRWIREKLRREGVSADELLPPPLKLRKERARLLDCRPGDGLRAGSHATAVADLNRRIAEWRRIPVGPPVFVPLVDAGRDGQPVAGARAAPPRPAARQSRSRGRSRRPRSDARWRRRAR